MYAAIVTNHGSRREPKQDTMRHMPDIVLFAISQKNT